MAQQFRALAALSENFSSVSSTCDSSLWGIQHPLLVPESTAPMCTDTKKLKLGVVARPLAPALRKQSLKPAWPTQQVLGQPELHSETLSQ